MVTTEKNISITRGDSFGFNFEIENLTEPLAACHFSCKETLDDAGYVFQKTLGDGIEPIPSGGYYVKIDPEDTADLEPRKYFFDLEVTIGSDIYTPLKGKLEIKWDVTGRGE